MTTHAQPSKRTVLPSSKDKLPATQGVLTNKPLMTQLTYALGRLPGIGQKSAQRLAFHLLKAEPDEVRHLATLMQEVKDKVTFCQTCHHLAEQTFCEFCQDPKRDRARITVVEESSLIFTIERTGLYRGLYHVLHGVINMIAGIGPGQIFADDLVDRVKAGGIQEIILATSHTSEGQQTALYLAEGLKETGVLVTRIASGIPIGSDLDYVDDVTLARSLEGRHQLHV